MSIESQIDIQSKLEDQERLQEIVRLGLHHHQHDDILQKYVDQAAKEFDLPISLITVVLPHSQLFSASTGLTGWMHETQGTPIEWSFCASSVETGKPYIVGDAPNHPKEASNPLVTLDNIHCYAGVPMITKNGQVIGNFCVLGHQSRNFSEEQIDRLREFATQAMQQIEKRVAESSSQSQ